MKPSLLKIKGINSFNGEQIIEFSRLVEKGLFGIFGPTGSGKSSILDAITLALYGNISRDSKEFINTEADRGEVSFEFEILDGKQRRRYRLERGIKHKKNGGIETTVARMVELEGEEIKVLAEGVTNVNQEVKSVIGLSAEDFTRSVVLPQGKFSEFLRLTGRERRNMLERIFGLEQYGKTIMDKISTQRKKYDMKRIDLEGQMKGYEGITEAYYKEVVVQLNLLLEEEQQLKAEIEKLDQDYAQGKRIWELQEERSVYEAIQKTLEEKKSIMEKNRKQLEMGKKASILRPYLLNLKKVEQKINENKLNLEKLVADLPRINEKLKEVQDKHQKSMAYKEEQFPILIAKIENCKQAEEMEAQNQVLIKEMNDLEEVYINQCKHAEEKTKGLEKLKAKRLEIQGTIKEIERYLDEIYMEPRLREGLEVGYGLERDIERISLEKKEDETLLLGLVKSIEENKTRLKEEAEKKQAREAELSGLIALQIDLEKSPLKEESIIYKNKMEIEKKRGQLTTLEDHMVQKSTLVKSLEVLLSEKAKIEANQSIAMKKIDEAEGDFEALKIQVKQIERESLAATLAEQLQSGDQCPVCGSKEHPHLAERKEEATLLEKNHQLSKYEESVLALREEKTKLDISLAQISKEEDLKRSSLEEVENLVKDQSLENLKKEVAELEKELTILTKEREAYTVQKVKTEEEIKKCQENINSINNLVTKLNIEIQKDSQTYEKLKSKVDQLQKSCNELSASVEELKFDLKIEKISQEYNQMKDLDKERLKKEKELKDLRKVLEAENLQREALEEELQSLNLKIVKNKQELDGNKQHVNSNIEKIKKLAENKKPKVYRLALENQIKEAEEAEKHLKLRVEKGSALQQKMIEEKAIAENNWANLDSEYNDNKLELEKMAVDQGFNAVEDIEEHVIIEAQLKELENQIIAYDDDVKSTKHNISRINQALDGSTLTEEAWEQIQTSLADKKRVQENRSKEIGESQRIVKDVKAKLENIKELKKEEGKITHKLDLLSELNKMLEGNRFVEYVAINQLKYIAKEASKWLKEITRGRYALELDSSGNFVMRDDFNGGIRRATNTLSGGETFLTSLALALALSSHIQLKGSAPLEFFFLDEGFGTLDSELLEIVMNALERLHSEKLSVGIISHVEELKSRVPIKLIVSPPVFGGEGTTIKII